MSARDPWPRRSVRNAVACARSAGSRPEPYPVPLVPISTPYTVRELELLGVSAGASAPVPAGEVHIIRNIELYVPGPLSGGYVNFYRAGGAG